MPTAAKKATARGANPTDAVSHLAEVTDRMHGLLMERADADGDREAVLMSWGLVLPERDKAPRRVTNVRNDKILEIRHLKQARYSCAMRRCARPRKARATQRKSNRR